LSSLAAALDAKDQYTQGHSLRVAEYAVDLGGAVGLSEADRRNLRRAGRLHDIGKIGISLDYLNKPGKLTTEEYELVKLHPQFGFDICKPLRTMGPLLSLIRGHHERLDGRGYPDGLTEEQIPITLRCLTIADIYDALTTDRVYRKAYIREDALEIMRKEASAGMWDARLIDTFAGVVLKIPALR